MFHGVVWSRRKVFFIFFSLNSSNGFFEKLMFSKGPSFFKHFVRNDGALNLSPHASALPALLTLSWQAKTTKKVNMIVLDFLVLVLQRFNSFDLNIFFQVLFSLNLTVYNGHVQLFYLGAVCSKGCFRKVENFVFVLFSVWNLQTVLPLKPMFSKGPLFFVVLFVIMGLYFVPACDRPASVSDDVMTSQEYLKVEQDRTWLLISSLAKFQQF